MDTNPLFADVVGNWSAPFFYHVCEHSPGEIDRGGIFSRDGRNWFIGHDDGMGDSPISFCPYCGITLKKG